MVGCSMLARLHFVLLVSDDTEERTTTAGIHLCFVITSKCTKYSDV